MANKGLSKNTKQLTRSIAGIDVSVNLNKNDANLIMAIPLLSTTGSLPINLSLFYNHQDRGKSTIFGNGMKLNLYKEFGWGVDHLTIKDASGTIDKFELIDGKYLSLFTKNQLEDITYNDDYELISYTIIQQDGTKLYFEDTNLFYPSKITLKTGEEYDIIFESNEFRIYNNLGSMVDVTHQNGQAIACGTYFNNVFHNWVGFTFENNHITKIRYNKNSALQNEIIFSYSETQLSILDTLTNHKLIFRLNGNMVTSIQEGIEGEDESFTSTSMEYSNNVTTIIDNNGNETYYYFDNEGTPLYVLDELGNATEETYNDYGLLTTKSSVVSPLFFEHDILNKDITEFENPNNFMLTKNNSLENLMIEATGGEIYGHQGSGILRYTLNKKLIQGDSLQLVTWLKYVEMQSDGAYIKVKMSCGDESVERRIYDEMDIYRLVTLGLHLEKSHEQILIEIEIVGQMAFEVGGIRLYQRDFGTHNTYDEYMNLIKVQTGKGNTIFEYDENHKVVSLTDKDSNKTTKEEKKEDESTSNFKGGKSPTGVITLNEYDNATGVLLSKTIYNPVTKQISVVMNEYDDHNRLLIKEYDNLNNFTEYTYDYFERVTESKDQTNHKMGYTYDYHDNLTDLKLNKHIGDDTYQSQTLVSNTYDDSNNLETTTSSNNSQYNFERDINGNITKVYLNDNLLVEFVYDLKGKLLKKLYSKDGYEFEYDVFNQVKKVYYLQNKITKILKYEYVYDILGRLIAVKDNEGVIIEEYQYDLDGNLCKSVNEECEINYTYDSNGLSKKEMKVLDSKLIQTYQSEKQLIDKSREMYISKLKSSNKHFSALLDDNLSIMNDKFSLLPLTYGNATLGKEGEINFIKGNDGNNLSYRLNKEGIESTNEASVAFWFKEAHGTSGYLFSHMPLYLYERNFENGKLEIQDDLTEVEMDNVSDELEPVPVLYAKVVDDKIMIGVNSKADTHVYEILSTNKIYNATEWNFFGMSFKKNDNNSYTFTVIFNGEIYTIDNVLLLSRDNSANGYDVPGAEEIDFGNYPVYAFGHNPVGKLPSSLTSNFNFTSIIIGNNTSLSESDLINYYFDSRDILIKPNDLSENDQFTNSSLIDISSDMLDNFKIYPLNGCLNSISGEKPIIYNKLYSDYKSFTYDLTMNNYVYKSNTDELVYETNIKDDGTVMLDVKLKDQINDQCIFELFDEDFNKIELYRNKNKKLYYTYGNSTYNTNLEVLDDVWTNISFSIKTLRASESLGGYPVTRTIRIIAGNSEYTNEILSITEFKTFSLSLGRKANCDLTEAYPMLGNIKMLIVRNAFLELSTVNTLKENIKVLLNTTEFDSFDRATLKIVKENSIDIITNKYDYKESIVYANHKLPALNLPRKDEEGNVSTDDTGYKYITPNVEEETITTNSNSYVRNYEYNSLNMVTKITDSTFGSHSYQYDERGFLTKEDNTVYQYDSNGNVTKKGDITFEYDGTIKDRLNKVGDKIITYSQDNPLLPKSFDGKTYEFEGNKLKTVTQNLTSTITERITFEYDHQGRRTSKTRSVSDSTITQSITTNYYFEGNNLITEIKDNLRYDYLYDENNILYGFIKNKTDKYFYIRDILMNILGIIDINGNIVVKYNYDAYGNLISISGNNHNLYNPFRYKGYYYDEETQLFYCNFRYYSPELCRWISPDSIEYLDPQNINGLNLYCYCGNNPIMYADPSGHFPVAALIIGAIVGAVIGAGSSIISQGIENNWDWSKFDVGLLIVDTVFGAIDGALSGLGLSLGASFLIDMGLSFAQSLTTSLIQGSEYTGLDFLLDTGLTMVSFGVSSLVGHGLNRAFKNSFSVDIDPGRLQGKWKSAVKSLQSNEGPRKKTRAILNKRYVKNTIAMSIGYYSIGGLTNGAISGLLGRI